MSRKSERRKRQQEDADLAALRWLMADERGRLWMWSLLDRLGLYANTMAGNAAQTAWMIGRQRAAVEVLAEVKVHCFPEYRLMEDEARAREQMDKLEREAEQPPAEIE